MRLSSGIAVAAMIAIVSAAGGEPRKSRPASPDLRTAKVVDLTHPFDSDTIYWPTSPTKFELKALTSGMTPGGWFYSANSFCAPEHGGTHLDAPIHFGRGRKTADQISVRQLVAPAVVIDVSESAAADPDYRLALSDVRAWEKKHGTIPGGAIVLLRTGWSKRWPDRKRYMGDDTPGDASNLHFPSYGADSARFLLRERRAGALGVDTASIDPGASKDFPVHRLAAENDVPGFENLDALDQVPERGAWVVALPMKIGGGSGGPLRIIALVP
ncbi:MAG TPA: cyclase family protein [Thermoanaerobaculia bacterium]|jgi:kynurenine formamidase|nr:cyclase family protein [Thermoanaerobaculia bacterium]